MHLQILTVNTIYSTETGSAFVYKLTKAKNALGNGFSMVIQISSASAHINRILHPEIGEYTFMIKRNYARR